MVAPSHDDPVVRAVTPLAGGPQGAHAGRSWWTPVRVLLLLVTVTFCLGALQKAPCAVDAWSDETVRFTHMCYSDIPYLYHGRGFAEGQPPYVGDDERYPYLEYPVLTGGLVFGAAVVTHALFGAPDVATLPVDEVSSNEAVADNVLPFTTVNALLLFGCALIATVALAGVHRKRPWDAALFALAPTLALAALINWDLLAVALVATALLAWSRSRPLLAGVLLGLGVAAKLYPLFLLGPLVILCLRSSRWRALGQVVAGTLAAWAVANLPVMLANYEGWKYFWSFNADRGADLGSLWYVVELLGHQISAARINLAMWFLFAAACIGIAALAVLARRRPRVAQLAFLVVAAFLLLNKVYSPQYVLWLLPLAALARPRWRDLLIWQAGEIVYFGAIWLYLSEDLAAATSGAPPAAYVLAVLIRVAAQLWLVGLVVRDVLQPWCDPVRRDGVTDDPAGGVLDEAPDVLPPSRR